MHFFHAGRERNPHALCDHEVALTVSQYVDFKVNLDGRNKNQIHFTAKKPIKNKKSIFDLLSDGKNWVSKRSLSLMLFEARKTYW